MQTSTKSENKTNFTKNYSATVYANKYTTVKIVFVIASSNFHQL